MNPRVKALLDKEMRPSFRHTEPTMDPDQPEQKNSCMPALIALALLGINGLASVGPMFSFVKPMEGNWQTMWQTLLVGAIAYFINSTAKSQQKDNTIATLSKG